jgi:hypothetical protein
LAQIGLAQWFFGNVYEAVVKVPDLIATGRHPATPLAAGSPVRYYLAALATAFPALCVAGVANWGERRSRPWLLAALTCSLAGAGLTAYLVRTVNLRLLIGSHDTPAPERERLLRTWHRLNLVRVAAVAGALVASRQARRAL